MWRPALQELSPELQRQRALYQTAAAAARQGAALQSLFRLALESVDAASGRRRRLQFLVAQGNGGAAGGGLRDFARQASTRFGAPLVPWGAVACPLGSAGAG